MTAYLSGIAQTRCEEHPRSEEIDLTMRAVLSAAAWFVGDKDGREPRCYASQSTIARKAGCHRTVVHRALHRLAALGVIEPVQGRPGVPVHWRLTLLLGEREPADLSRSATGAAGDLSSSATGPVAEDDTPCSAEQHNPSDSSRPPGSEERGRGRRRSDAASGASPLPGGRGDAAASSMVSVGGSAVPAEVLAEIAQQLDYSLDQAQVWAGRKLAASKRPVGDTSAYLGQCLAGEQEQRAKPRQAARDTPARPSKVRQLPTRDAQQLAAARAPRTSRADQLVAGRRVLDGELTVDQLAAEVDRDASTVRQWVTAARNARVRTDALRDAG